MPPDPLKSSLIYILLQICPDFATHRKKLRVRKLGAPLLKKFLSLQMMELIREVSNRVEKARNCPNACRYQRAPSGAFWGGGQQFSHGTGGGAWTKITNAKWGVTEKV